MDSVDLAKRIRINAVNMVNAGGSSHIGSVLSIADILAVLYGKIMKYDPENPKWDKRDRFILSKGHAGAGVYAVLAECGFFDRKLLLTHYQNHSNFSGHVSHKDIPGVEVSTGSLGHGLSIATGMALAAKMDGCKHRIFVLIGDGELAEGSNWEAMLFAAHHKLNNLTLIIDRNNLQSMDTTENTMALEPLIDKFVSFNWSVERVNGHEHDRIANALSNVTDSPLVIIADTVKGKGISYMENKVEWHYKTPTGDLYKQALDELEVL